MYGITIHVPMVHSCTCRGTKAGAGACVWLVVVMVVVGDG